MKIDVDYINEILADLRRISEQPKCECKISSGKWDDEISCQTDWTRCRACNGLVSAMRYVEGTAELVPEVLQ